MALIRIQHPQNPQHSLLINENRYDPAKHTKVGEKARTKGVEKPTAQTPKEVAASKPAEAKTNEGESVREKVEQEKKEDTKDLPKKELAKGVTTIAASRREKELRKIYNTKGWRAIKVLADNVGIKESPDGGWDDAIPLIVAAENKN